MIEVLKQASGCEPTSSFTEEKKIGSHIIGSNYFRIANFNDPSIGLYLMDSWDDDGNRSYSLELRNKSEITSRE